MKLVMRMGFFFLAASFIGYYFSALFRFIIGFSQWSYLRSVSQSRGVTGVFQFCLVIYLPCIHSTGLGWKGADEEASSQSRASNRASAESDLDLVVHRRVTPTMKRNYSGDKSGVNVVLLHLNWKDLVLLFFFLLAQCFFLMHMSSVLTNEASF